MIDIKGYKLVWFENVFGWIMTGIIGPNGRWFFGYSESQYPVHDNEDLRELLNRATRTDSSDTILKMSSDLLSTSTNELVEQVHDDPDTISTHSVPKGVSYVKECRMTCNK